MSIQRTFHPAGQRDREADENREHIFHTLVLHELVFQVDADQSKDWPHTPANIQSNP